MKKHTILFIAFISICLIASLSACDLLTKSLRLVANKIDQKDSEELSQADEFRTIVAEQFNKTAIAQLTEEPPKATSTPQPERQFEGTTFSYKGISFTIPKGLSTGIKAEDFDETTSFLCAMEKDKGAAYSFVQFLPDDPFDSSFRAVIYIISYKSYYETCDYGLDDIDELKVLISTSEFSAFGPLEPLPIPSIFNARQMYHSKEKMLTFQNGSGIRFLSEFHQDAAVPSTSALRYVFAGMTEDENYIISAVIDMRKSPLPDEPEYPENMEEFFSHYDLYNINAANLLNKTPDNAFDPNLELLDRLFESLKVIN